MGDYSRLLAPTIPSSPNLERWRGTFYPAFPSATFAHLVDLKSEAENVYLSVSSDLKQIRQFVESGGIPDRPSEQCFAPLFRQYPVDPSNWWRRRRRPPGFVQLPDLPWGEAGSRIVHRILDLWTVTEPACSVLSAADSIAERSERPSDDEVRAAIEYLAMHASKIEAKALELAAVVGMELEDREPVDVPQFFICDSGAYEPVPTADGDTYTIRFKHWSLTLGRGKKFELFERLSRRPGFPVSMKAIKNDVWNDPEASRGTVYQTVYELNEALRNAGIFGLRVGQPTAGMYALIFDR